uniref:PDZ domain-containing protein n=1 Tax=Timema cristinae TaxID=61476 RepID=A0A7R9DIQ0_TIMCR|nr:unnamed protein product [Timema cristinae]
MSCGVCPTTNILQLGDNSAGVPPSDYIDDVTGEDRTKQHTITVDEKKVLDKDYPLPIHQSESMPSVVPRIVHISLKKEEGSLGLTLRGGVHPDPLLCRPLVITYVRPGGPAHRVRCLVTVPNTITRNYTHSRDRQGHLVASGHTRSPICYPQPTLVQPPRKTHHPKLTPSARQVEQPSSPYSP